MNVNATRIVAHSMVQLAASSTDAGGMFSWSPSGPSADVSSSRDRGKIRLKRFVKGLLRRLRLFRVRTFHSFDVKALRRALSEIGVARGDTLLVHSGYDAFTGFTGKPADVITVLEEMIGPHGTILMPSMPFNGTAIEYLRSGAITDIARTPSRMGLLTEIFRRQKGTIRSVHPTHPVLARGASATYLTAGHENAPSPCGTGSPFAKLLETDGKILFLGTSIDTMTFFHNLEERYENRLHPSPLTEEIFPVEVRDAAGRTIIVKTRLFEPAVSRRRRIEIMLPELRRRQDFRTARVGLLSIYLVKSSSVRDAFEATLTKGMSFYAER
jgi:aminoglycoside 3-N-acetyltransferase